MRILCTSRKLSIPLELLKNMFQSTAILRACEQCPNFGRLWSCPPNDEQAEKILSTFSTANILSIVLRPDPNDSESQETFSLTRACDTIKTIRHTLDPLLLELEAQTPNSLALFAGSCVNCDNNECARISGQSCKTPEKTRYSLESLGFDICSMADIMFNIKIDWATSEKPADKLCLFSALLSKKEIDFSKILQHFSENINI